MHRRLIPSLIAAATALVATHASAYSANKAWVERINTDVFRVHVSYTVPELKELRESYVEFRKAGDADAYYLDILRGADFYPPNPKARRFTAPALEPTPW